MALKLLFGSDFGILSVITIGVVLIMGGYYAWYFAKHMKDADPGAK